MGSFYERVNTQKTLGDDREDALSRAAIDKWIFHIFLVMLGVMPLIVLAHVEEVVSPLISSIAILSTGTKGELFTHFKSVFVLIVTIITGLMLLAKIYFMNGTIRKTWLNYVLGAFALIIVISTVFSPNITVALNGQYNRSDGAVSWLCYIALVFIAMNINYPKKAVQSIMYAMMPFVYINLYIITMNFYGRDILQWSWLENLIAVTLPAGAGLSEGSQLVGTLNQWNYMSGMFAMMTVMYLAWAITSKDLWESILGAVTAAAAITVMWMSISTSGFLTFSVLTIVLFVIVLRIKHKKQALISIAVFVILGASSFHILAPKDYRVWQESIGLFIEKSPYLKSADVSLQIENKAYASDATLELPVLPEAGVSAGSGRMYIWEKGLEAAMERPLLGYGGDSFIYNFPHYNIDARAGMNNEHVIVDKPHNVYVGVMFSFGIFTLLMIVALLGTSLVTLVKAIVIKSWTQVILGITVLAYFIQAMFNDSLPSTSAIAFMLLGMLIALKYTENEGILTDGRDD